MTSQEYIQKKLKDNHDYLGCSDKERMKLIKCDMYKLKKAYEDGVNDAIEKACAYLATVLWTSRDDDGDFIVESVSNGTIEDLMEDFKQGLRNNYCLHQP